MKSFYLLIYSLFVTLSFSQEKLEQTQFGKANTYYNEAKYNEAVNIYNDLVENGFQSSELFFNLGNAHYKLNNTAQSIYYFEKALQLNPQDESIKQNLAFANNMKIDAIEVLPEIGYTKYFNTFSKLFSTDAWAIFAIAFSLLFVTVLIVYFFVEKTQLKRLTFILSGAFLILSLFSLSVANYRSNNIDNKRFAIVFAKETKVKAKDSFKSEDLFALHEGTKIAVLESSKNWFHIKLTNGKTGWILKEDVKVLDKI